MKKLISLFYERLIFAGKGESCPLHCWGEFDDSDLFFIFPATRYFVVYRQSEGRADFFKIVNSMDDVPDGCQLVVEKFNHSEDLDFSVEAFYCLVSKDEIIHKFGKKYKFLLYEMDLLS